MADAYEFRGADDSSGVAPEQLARCVAKLKGSSKTTQLKALADLLEKLPQDVGALGTAREALEDALLERSILGSKHKDVRMYAAACFAQLLRIYAPDTPFEDAELEPVFELLLWSVQQVQEYQAPTFDLAVSVLSTISSTKSYYVLLDLGREEAVLDWVRTLLQCINHGSAALAGPHARQVLSGLVGDDSSSEAVLEVLLSHLVPPRSTDSPAAYAMAQNVLKDCEASIKPALQRFLTTLILSPISSNTDLHRQAYALISQVYQAVPQVLLPVMPHLTSELHSEADDKRLEAVRLLGQLLSQPGNRLVSEYSDVLVALLGRYKDTQTSVRTTMLEFTPALVAAAGSEDLQQQVLEAAAGRLVDYDDKVRLAAVAAVAKTARQLLVGPPPAAGAGAGAPGASARARRSLGSPIDALLMPSPSSQQEDEAAAAADLQLAATPADAGATAAAAPGAQLPAASVRDAQFVHEALRQVYMRLRDTKPAVRKGAADHLLGVFRAVVAADDATHAHSCCWLAARVLLCCKTDPGLAAHVMEGTARDGLLPPKTPAPHAAALWVRLWLGSSELEREALLVVLLNRTRLQVGALQLLAQRRKLAGRSGGGAGASQAPAAAPGTQQPAGGGPSPELQQLVQRLVQQLPQPDKAAEALQALLAVRDNHAFTALQTALMPGTSQQAYAKARADALSRVGSRSQAADAVNQLLLWGRPAAWLPGGVLAALLQLVRGDPDGKQGDLVAGAYQLLQSVAKVAPLLFVGLLPQLHELLLSDEPDLQELGAHLLARCAAHTRKCGLLLAAAPEPATAQLVKAKLLPCLRQLARGRAPAAVAAARRSARAAASERTGDSGEGSGDEGEDAGGAALDPASHAAAAAAGTSTPKAAKWAVFGLVACQDSASSQPQLEALADELAGRLDSGAPDTAAKLRALSMIGRLMPGAFGRHAEALLHFVTEDYLLSYLDAAATAAARPSSAGGSAGSGGSRRRRSGGGSMLLSPASHSDGGGGDGGEDAAALAVELKAAALKALAAGCVPNSDAHDVPVETLRVTGRLALFLEGLLEPDEASLSAFLADASPELCGQLRLAAASALLRLARRHDARLPASTYCSLSLMMQDPLESVRAAFAAKVFRLVNHLKTRNSRQLPAKYAAMLPLAAADPVLDNKEAAARQLRVWVHDKRAAAAAAVAAAAAGARGGGSTLTELPEMVLPYGLYLLAHHPDFPTGEDADDAAAYEPFQFMLQFMLQPLLVPSATSHAGATLPALLKMARSLKRTADTAEAPATTQLHCLCDMAVATLEALAERMGLDTQALGSYPGDVVLPKGLYRALERAEHGASGVSYLPPGFAVVLDPQPAPALAAPPGTATGAGKGGKAKRGGRGSKRKAAAGEAAAEDGAAPKRARSAKGRSKARKKAAADSDSDGWGSDEEEAPPSPDKAGHLTKRQQVLAEQQQKQQQKQQQRQASASHSAGAESDEAGAGLDGADSPDSQSAGSSPAPPPPPQQQQRRNAKHAQRKQPPEPPKQAQRKQAKPAPGPAAGRPGSPGGGTPDACSPAAQQGRQQGLGKRGRQAQQQEEPGGLPQQQEEQQQQPQHKAQPPPSKARAGRRQQAAAAGAAAPPQQRKAGRGKAPPAAAHEEEEQDEEEPAGAPSDVEPTPDKRRPAARAATGRATRRRGAA